MTEPLQVGQFAIVDGQPVDCGPNAGVFHGKGPSDDRAELFLLAEGTTPAAEAFAGHVISAVGQAFASLDMSLTGSLTRLFHEAEGNVRDWNRKSIAQHRVSLGLTAFGRRGGQAVIAQAGPTAAFHLHEGKMSVFCADGESARGIGAAPVQPQLTKIAFEPGDRLLLFSSAAVRELDDDLIEGILSLPEDQVLPNLFRRLQQMRQVTVLLVTGPHPAPARGKPAARRQEEEEFVIGAEAADEPPAASDTSFQPSLFIEDEAEISVLSARAQLEEVTPRRAITGPTPLMEMEPPAPLLRVSGESAISMSRLAAEGAARAARSRAAVSAVPPVALAPAPALNGSGPQNENGYYVAHGSLNSVPGEPMPPSGLRNRKAQSFSRGLVNPGVPPARPESLAEDLPLAAELAAGQRARAALRHPVPEAFASEDTALAGGATLVRPRSNMGHRWKGNNSLRRRTAVGGQLPPTWLVILGGLVVLILIAGIATVPGMLGNDNAERVATLISGAQERFAESARQADPAQKRQLLTDAHGLLLDAREKGAVSETDALLAQVSAAIAEMDNVRQPAAVESVASLEQFGTRPVAVARMVVAADSAYLLDVNSAQVVAVPMNGTEPSVVFAENKDQKRSKPIAIAYVESAQAGGPLLLVADSANKLWSYTPAAGVRSVAFGAPANLTIADIAVLGPDLFVLDAAQATIYRFIPESGGFPGTPLVAVKNADLGAGRRLMADGEFITADANGAVHRFIAGGQTAVTFSQAGIDRRLAAPETAQAVTANGEVAMLDAPNNRIVILRRDGGFVAQYRHPDFATASAFVIRNGEWFIFSGARLRRITL